MLVNKFREAGINHVKISAGYRLSYPDEKLFMFYLDEFETKLIDLPEGVYTCLIENEDCEEQILTPGIDDEIFSRTKVPMTKNEVRVLSISRLELTKNAVVYDVGSGTGSIAVEAASLSDDMEVYAIEQKENAVQLITQNKEKHGLENIHVINAKAPDGMDTLPVPTHAFIGGSGGNLKEIIEALKVKNPHIRIVINAISIETICEIKEIMSAYDVKNEDIVQLQVSRSKQIGHYHLMQAENPVWICSFEF